jgi:ABC-type phosphate transport system substrate-binding protein
MTFLSPRRFISACVLSAAAMAALMAPGAANAALGTQCSGSSITGKGANVQKLAQLNVWDPDFSTSSSPKACNGTQGSKGTPTVTYSSIGSGAGLETWGVNGHAFEGSTSAFVATDEAPNQLEREEIQSHSSNPAEETLETIPVAESSIAIIVDLPKGCTSATSTASPGRLVLDNVTLEKIWRGAIANWSEITDGGDKLVGTSCSASAPITRIVRPDSAGLTNELKKYLALIDTERNIVGELGWNGLSEGAENVVWPGTVTRSSEKGDNALIKLVSETRGSIGYANLGDARANGSFTGPNGGINTRRFWVEIQNNGVEQTGETYADPSVNGDNKELSNSNCSNTVYTNGEVPFPPASTLELWNEVTTRTAEERYSLCALTYILTFKSYSKYPGTTLEEATTVNNFALFVLAGGGGQELLKKHDYYPLPSSLAAEGRVGAGATKF